MAVRTIECTECGTTVPYGRLSCPSCGELLASVAGAARSLTSLSPAVSLPPAFQAVAPAAAPPGDMEAGDAGSAGPDDDRSVGGPWLTPAFPPQPTDTVAPPAETPGAYVPPSPALPAADAIIPAGRPAPARAWAGASSGAELSLTDPARRAEAIDWIAVAGAALGSVGFLLPWARSIIGADGVGYLDTWGFAGPAHVVVVAGMLVVLGLAVATTRIPAWLRLGIPGLILSALLVGLLWPYILGPLGSLPGAYLSLAGALVLGVASVAALATDRHARPHPRV